MSRITSHDSPSQQKHIVPFGPYGGGQMTAHPIGLVIVLGFLAMGLAATEELRWLILASVGGGAVLGFILWLRHR